MLKTETTTKTVTEKHSVRLCDLCGQPPRLKEDEAVEVEHRTGERYYKGSLEAYTAFGFDLCAGCFHDKLVPWLKSQGAEPRTQHHEYER